VTSENADSSEQEAARQQPTATRAQLLSGMRMSIIEGTFALILSALTSGSVMTGLALMLGATPVQISLLSGLPTLANLFQIIVPLWAERLPSRKLYTTLAAGMNRGLLCLSVLTIFLPPHIRIYAFLGALGASYIFASISTTPWQTWMSDLVPEDIRGRFFARRNAIINVTYMLVAPIAGKVLDLFPGSQGFLILYGVGLIIMFCNVGAMALQYEPPYHPTKQSPRKLLRTYRLAFRNRQFALTLMFFVVWTFARALADPFFNVYMIQNLKISYLHIKIFETISFFMLVASSMMWGYLINKLGNKNIAKGCAIAFILTPLIWVFTTPDSYNVLYFNFALAGFLAGGMNIANFNILLATTPRKNKSVYLSLWAAINGVAGFLGAFTGGHVIEYLSDFSFNIGTLHIGNMQIIFIACGIMTMLSCLIFPDIKEPRKAANVSIVQMVRLLNPMVLFGLIYNLTIFNISREEKSKLKASKALGKLKSPLAVNELIEAMDDPSLAVREQAAISLGEIGDPQAVDILIKKLQSPEENIQEEAAKALGLIHTPKAVPPLMNRLNDPDPSLRATVINALGNIKDERAREALYERLTIETDPKIFPSLVEALSNMQDPRVVNIALQRLDHFGSPVVRRQILDSIAYMLDDDDDFYEVTGLDPFDQDQWIHKHIKNMKRRIIRRKSPFARESHEQLKKIFDSIWQSFESERYDPCVHHILSFCNIVQETIEQINPENELDIRLIKLELNAITTLINLNNSVNLNRDEVLFMLVALDRLCDELTQ
jgi:MFS family permease